MVSPRELSSFQWMREAPFENEPPSRSAPDDVPPLDASPEDEDGDEDVPPSAPDEDEVPAPEEDEEAPASRESVEPDAGSSPTHAPANAAEETIAASPPANRENKGMGQRTSSFYVA